MKNLYTISTVIITLLLSAFSTNALDYSFQKGYVILKSKVLSLTVNSESDYKFFVEADYNETKEEMVFITKDKTSQIRIYDKLDNLMFILPVRSDRIQIGKSLFKSGNFKLIFDSDVSDGLYKSELNIY